MTMAPSASERPNIEALRAKGDIPGLIKALGYFGWTSWLPDTAQEALVQIGEPAIDPLIASLQEPDEIKRRAIRALGKIGDVRAIEPLIAAFGDARVQNDVAVALVWIGVPSVEPLIAALADPNEGVREFAAAALGAIGDVRAMDPLLVALTDSRPAVKQAAAGALEQIGALDFERVL